MNRLVFDDIAVGADKSFICFEDSSDDQRYIDEQTGASIDIYKPVTAMRGGNKDENPASFEDTGFSVFDQETFFYDIGKRIDSGHFASDSLGFVSEWASDATGSFLKDGKYPKLVIHSITSYSGNGISVTYRKYPCSVHIYYLLNDRPVYDEYYDSDSLECYYPAKGVKYNNIQIEFISSTPNVFASVKKIVFGKSYNITKIRSISTSKKVDLMCSDVSIGTMDVSFVVDEQIDFGFNRKIKLYKDDVLTATYRVFDCEKVTNDMYSLTCEDSIGTLYRTKFSGIVYPENISSGYYGYIRSYLNAIKNFSGVSITNKDDDDFNVKIHGFIPTSDCRKALLYCCYLAQRIPVTDEEGNITLVKVEKTSPKKITGNSIIGDATYKQYDDITSISTSFSKVVLPDLGKSMLTAYSGTVYPSYAYTVVNEPIYSCDGFPKDEESTVAVGVLKISADEIRFIADREVDAIIKYQSYDVSTETMNWSKPDDNEVDAVYREKKLIDSALYYSSMKSWFSDICDISIKNKGRVTAKVILDNVDIGDYVEIETKYSGWIKGVVTEVNADHGVSSVVGDIVIEQC